MYKLTIIAVGKLKESWWADAALEYDRRLRPFARLKIVEVESAPFGGSVTASQSMKIEAGRILKHLPDDANIVVLDREGRAAPSHVFAQTLQSEGESGKEIVFIIGGATGLDEAVLARAHKKISLSEMTFAHEMARVILLEQLYRAMTILTGKKYHY